MSFYLGIDIGGSSIKFGYGKHKDGLLFFASEEMYHPAIISCELQNPELLKEQQLAVFRMSFARILEKVEREIGVLNIAAIGIGTPGMVDHRKGLICGVNPNLQFWTGLSPASVLPEAISQPVFFDNDANLMTLAEASNYPDERYVLGITLGSGIGSGYVFNAKVYHGARGFAMEIGHVPLVPNGARCNCGKNGCLEAYASVNGLRNRIIEAGISSPLPDLRAILKLAKNSDEVMAIIRNGQQMLALALAQAVLLLEPDTIIIGGGGSEAGLYPIHELEKELYSHLPETHRPMLCLARLGNRAGVFGAILLAEQQFSNMQY